MSAGFLIGNSDDSKTDKSQSYSNSTDSGQSDRLLESQQDCTAHISKVKSLQRKVYILVLLFSLLLILYIGTSVYIITTLAHLQEDSNLRLQAPSAQGVIDTNTLSQSEYRFCINEADIAKFGDTWKKMDHLKSKGDVCFKTFSWFPQITNLMHSALSERIQYLEEQIESIQINRSANDPSKGLPMGLNFGQSMGTPYSYKPFAHLFLNVTAVYQDNSGPLKWTKAGIEGSNTRGMEIIPESGDLRVRQSGYYFVYSHLMYKLQRTTRETTSGRHQLPPIHSVFKNYRDTSSGGKTKLLESGADIQGPTSFLLGIFLFKAGDTLSVCAPIYHLHNDTGRFNYLGAFLI